MENDTQQKVIRIYSNGHKTASKDDKFSTKIKAHATNTLIFIGAFIVLFYSAGTKLASVGKGSFIHGVIYFAAFVYLVAEFIKKRRKHVITFDENGVSIKEPKLFSKSYTHSAYTWEDIAYVVRGKKLQQGSYLFLDKAQNQLFTISDATYDFSEKDIADGLAIAPSEIKELTYEEYKKAHPITWKWCLKRCLIIALTILVIFVLLSL